jgi:hypothetical protein
MPFIEGSSPSRTPTIPFMPELRSSEPEKLRRPARSARLPTGVAASRTMTLCPPAGPPMPWTLRMREVMSRLLAPLRGPGGAGDGQAAALASTRPWTEDDEEGTRGEWLARLRTEFVATLSDLDGDTTRDLEVRLHLCTGVRELWNLRPALFQLVSGQRGQAEAQRRLAGLDRHFPRRAAGGRVGLRSVL